MKWVVVCGSRGFTDQKFLFAKMDALLDKLGTFVVLSGHAEGADKLGEEWATQRMLTYRVYHPDYEAHGKRAPLVRNVEMIKEADALVAFWNGKSTGTAHAINLAKMKRIKVKVFRFAEKE